MIKKSIMIKDEFSSIVIYDLINNKLNEEGGSIDFFYSRKDSNWNPSIYDEPALSIINDGNGYLLYLDKNNPIRIDYSAWEILFVIFNHFEKSCKLEVFEIKEIK